MITAVIIDDERGSRSFLKGHLKAFCPDVKIVGEAETVGTGLNLIQLHKPDIIFMDIKIQEQTGYDLIELLKKEQTGPMTYKIIFTSALNESTSKREPIILDYLQKPIDPDELLISLRKAM